MEHYELRQVEDGLELSGGMLKEPLKYSGYDPEASIRVVGFLSQRHGSVLRIFAANGELVETQNREPLTPLSGAVGGLKGPGCNLRLPTNFFE